MDEKKQKEFSEKIGKKELLKLKARKEKGKGIMLGIIGWSVAIPTLIGIAIGMWFDKKFQDEISWTLTFLILGVVTGCFNAWHWVRRESRNE